MVFRSQLKIRFGDIDHAGIVYYPHTDTFKKKDIPDWLRKRFEKQIRDT